MKIGKGRGGAREGRALTKKFIDLAKNTDVVAVGPEQRARILAWARQQIEIELQSGQHRNGDEDRARYAGQTAQLIESVRAAGRLRRATAAH